MDQKDQEGENESTHSTAEGITKFEKSQSKN